MRRKVNFFAGPSVLPMEVLRELQHTMIEYPESGLSLIETSHRSSAYDAVHSEAIELLSELINLPDTHQILLLQGGATLQFGMVPMNFLPADKNCGFVLTGSWSKKALADAEKVGSVQILYDGASDNYSRIPDQLQDLEGLAYVHITSNETIHGVQWKQWPDTGSIPLIADMSSDILSRSIPVEKFALIYAGAQKNLGPAGVTVVIIRKDLLKRCPGKLPAYLNYAVHADKNSLYNTPPVFSIYALSLVMKWIKQQGGVKEMEKRNMQKAQRIYSEIDESAGFYKNPVEKASRSLMNIPFTLPSKTLEEKFLAESQAAGMVGLKGHRSLGGCRASLYNAMNLEGAEKLADFMRRFKKENG